MIDKSPQVQCECSHPKKHSVLLYLNVSNEYWLLLLPLIISSKVDKSR